MGSLLVFPRRMYRVVEIDIPRGSCLGLDDGAAIASTRSNYHRLVLWSMVYRYYWCCK